MPSEVKQPVLGSSPGHTLRRCIQVNKKIFALLASAVLIGSAFIVGCGEPTDDGGGGDTPAPSTSGDGPGAGKPQTPVTDDAGTAPAGAPAGDAPATAPTGEGEAEKPAAPGGATPTAPGGAASGD